MFYDLASFIEAEDVDASPVRLAQPRLVAVQDHVVSFNDNALELDPAFLRLPHNTALNRIMMPRI